MSQLPPFPFPVSSLPPPTLSPDFSDIITQTYWNLLQILYTNAPPPPSPNVSNPTNTQNASPNILSNTSSSSVFPSPSPAPSTLIPSPSSPSPPSLLLSLLMLLDDLATHSPFPYEFKLLVEEIKSHLLINTEDNPTVNDHSPHISHFPLSPSSPLPSPLPYDTLIALLRDRQSLLWKQLASLRHQMRFLLKNEKQKEREMEKENKNNNKNEIIPQSFSDTDVPYDPYSTLNHIAERMQRKIQKSYFSLWKKNTKTLKIQRNKIQIFISKWQIIKQKYLIKSLFIRWKTAIITEKRTLISPQVVASRAKQSVYSNEISEISTFLDTSATTLSSLLSKIESSRMISNELNDNIKVIKECISLYSSLPPQDIFPSICHIMIDMLKFLQEELEYGLIVYQYDPCRMVWCVEEELSRERELEMERKMVKRMRMRETNGGGVSEEGEMGKGNGENGGLGGMNIHLVDSNNLNNKNMNTSTISEDSTLISPADIGNPPSMVVEEVDEDNEEVLADKERERTIEREKEREKDRATQQQQQHQVSKMMLAAPKKFMRRSSFFAAPSGAGMGIQNSGDVVMSNGKETHPLSIPLPLDNISSIPSSTTSPRTIPSPSSTSPLTTPRSPRSPRSSSTDPNSYNFNSKSLYLSRDTMKYETFLLEINDQKMILLWANYHIYQILKRQQKVREGQEREREREKEREKEKEKEREKAASTSGTTSSTPRSSPTMPSSTSTPTPPTTIASAYSLYRKYYKLENFTTDLRDCFSLLLLLEEIAPTSDIQRQCSVSRQEIDNESRARAVIRLVSSFNKDAAALITVEEILHSSHPDLMAAFLGKLMGQQFSIENIGIGDMVEGAKRVEEMMREMEMVMERWRNGKGKGGSNNGNINFGGGGGGRMISQQRVGSGNSQRGSMVNFNNTYNNNNNNNNATASNSGTNTPIEDSDSMLSSSSHPMSSSSSSSSLSITITEDSNAAQTQLTPLLSSMAQSIPSSPFSTSSFPSPSPSPSSASSASSISIAIATYPSRTSPPDPLSKEETSTFSLYLTSFYHRYLSLYSSLRPIMDRSRHVHDIYRECKGRMDRMVLNVLVRRLQVQPMGMMNGRERRDRLAFTIVEKERIEEIIHVANLEIAMTATATATTHANAHANNMAAGQGHHRQRSYSLMSAPPPPVPPPSLDQEILLIQSDLSTHYVELRKIFRYYAINETEYGSTISWQSIEKMIGDCKVIGGKIKSNHIEDIWNRVTGKDEKEEEEGEGESKENTPRMGMGIPMGMGLGKLGSVGGNMNGVGGKGDVSKGDIGSNMYHGGYGGVTNNNNNNNNNNGAKVSPRTHSSSSFSHPYPTASTAHHFHCPSTTTSDDLTPSGFIEFIIRLADLKYRVSLSTSLSDRFSAFLRHHIIRYGRRIDTDSFRVKYSTMDFIEIFRKYKRKLKNIFGEIGRRGREKKEREREREREKAIGTGNTQNKVGSPNMWSRAKPWERESKKREKTEGTTSVPSEGPLHSHSTIPLTDPDDDHDDDGNGIMGVQWIDATQLMEVCRESKLMGMSDPTPSPPLPFDGSLLSPDDFFHIISSVRKSDFCTSPGIVGTLDELQLDYNDFLEFLVAVACYRYPDPYTPLAGRVEHFLQMDLQVEIR